MQPVHDQHDRPLLFVVEPAVKGVGEPLVGALTVGFRQCLFGLQRVLDNDDVRTPPGQHAADRGGDPADLGRRVELRHRLMLRREPGREGPPVPVAGDDRRQSRDNLSASSCAWLTQRICALGLRPRHQAGNATEASSDFRWRGGGRILPPNSSVSFAVTISTCQPNANGVRGLSSRKQHRAKLVKSRCSSPLYPSPSSVTACILEVSPQRRGVHGEPSIVGYLLSPAEK